jgi:hypothetical protein
MKAENIFSAGGRHCRAIMSILMMALGLVHAGPNQNASLSVDVDYQTAPVESLGSAEPGAPFWIAVRIAGAEYLDTYGFKLGFDSSRVRFLQAVPELPSGGIGNFLASRGGTSVGFLGSISNFDSTQVTVANGLAGRDSSRTPRGSGVLVLMQFLAKGPALGKAVFTLSDGKLLDWQQSLDTAIAMHAGTVILQADALVLSRGYGPRRAEPSRLESIAMALRRQPLKSGFYLLGRRN